ncbi:MAG: MBL fold metallo-hydrolase, partial [Candidatus Aminicenantes bacterium]
MKYENVIVGPLETNCYLIYCEQTLECAVMDPGAEPKKIFQAIAEIGLQPVVLINTHGHVDHVGANKDVMDKYGMPLLMHSADAPMLKSILQSGLGLFLGAKNSPPPKKLLSDGDEVKFGTVSLKTLHTPGHSPGSLSFYHNGVLFSGDTLFCGGVGRTDLPGGSWEAMIASIRNKILTFPDDTIVLPGHG